MQQIQFGILKLSRIFFKISDPWLAKSNSPTDAEGQLYDSTTTCSLLSPQNSALAGSARALPDLASKQFWSLPQQSWHHGQKIVELRMGGTPSHHPEESCPSVRKCRNCCAKNLKLGWPVRAGTITLIPAASALGSGWLCNAPWEEPKPLSHLAFTQGAQDAGLLLLFSRQVVSSSLQPHELYPTRLLCPWDFQGRSTGVAISSSRGSSWPRDWNHIFCIGRQFLYHWATKEAPRYREVNWKIHKENDSHAIFYFFFFFTFFWIEPEILLHLPPHLRNN